MTLMDWLKVYLHGVVFFWHGGRWFDINLKKCGFVCDCGKKFGNTDLEQFFKELR